MDRLSFSALAHSDNLSIIAFFVRFAEELARNARECGLDSRSPLLFIEIKPF